MAPAIGFLVTTVAGTPIYQGWTNRHSALPTRQLSNAVAGIFAQSPEQESTFIQTGPYAVASVLEPAFIVSVVCSSSSSEPEMLMKAKELAHNIKVLLGEGQIAKLASRRPEDLERMMSSASLHRVLLLCFEADEETRVMEEKRQKGATSSKGSFVIVVDQPLSQVRSTPTARALEWIKGVDETAGKERLDDFFVEKLKLASPCEDGFVQLSKVDGFVSAHLLDLCDPTGEVLLHHWRPLSGSVSGHLGEAVLQMLQDPSSSLWALILNETRKVIGQDREDKPETSLLSCTLDLTSFEPGLHATVRMLFLDEYDPAFIVFYKVSSFCWLITSP